jgi:hypothetical protein
MAVTTNDTLFWDISFARIYDVTSQKRMFFVLNVIHFGE